MRAWGCRTVRAGCTSAMCAGATGTLECAGPGGTTAQRTSATADVIGTRRTWNDSPGGVGSGGPSAGSRQRTGL
eukprot:3067302-Rhodomonas_salina.2